MSNCIQEVQTIFSTTLLRDVTSPSVDLLESGVLDSMSFVELLLNLEQHFGMSFDVMNLELENFRSIETIAALVSDRLQTKFDKGSNA